MASATFSPAALGWLAGACCSAAPDTLGVWFLSCSILAISLLLVAWATAVSPGSAGEVWHAARRARSRGVERRMTAAIIYLGRTKPSFFRVRRGDVLYLCGSRWPGPRE